jgi:monoamine oxidase
VRLKKDFDIEVEFGHSLVSIHRKNSRYILTFQIAGGRTKEFSADKVILALPFGTLPGVEGLERLGLNEEKSESIFRTQIGYNSKVMLDMKTRVWEEGSRRAPKSSGKIFCDNSLRAQSYWDTSRSQRSKGERGILTSYLGGSPADQLPRDYSGMMLEDISRLYPNARSLAYGRPDLVVHKIWKTNPYSRGAYSCPAPGHYFDFLGSEGEPEIENTFALVGETADIEYQGFMNGAVRSAIAAARALA